ncbi:hypothetical protein GCM10010327_61960 [Streptomyces nitrosporeus]|nr:hypothetical protein GCM10010327_61960 [Streptomyces nitrosporeus]
MLTSGQCFRPCGGRAVDGRQPAGSLAAPKVTSGNGMLRDIPAEERVPPGFGTSGGGVRHPARRSRPGCALRDKTGPATAHLWIKKLRPKRS